MECGEETFGLFYKFDGDETEFVKLVACGKKRHLLRIPKFVLE